MDQTNRSTVVGVFRDRDQAREAVDELRRNGFPDDRIGFAWRGETGTTSAETENDTYAGEGAASGAVVGGLLGAAAALLIPGIGPAIAGGILVPALGGAAGTAAGVAAAGAVAGAAAGGLSGALVGMGVPEDEARHYEEAFRSGWTVVTVNSGPRFEHVRAILTRYGGRDVQSRDGVVTSLRGDPPSAQAVGGFAAPVGAPEPGAEPYHRHGDTNTVESAARVPGRGTRPDNIGHDHDTSGPSGRAEDLATTRPPEQPPREAEWRDISPHFRDEWQSRHGAAGGRWDDYEPAYRFGYESATEPRYQGREYGDAESDMRRDWEARGYPGRWDDVSGHAREAWERRRATRR